MGVNAYEYLIFDGKSTGEFGVWISGGGTFDAPARDVEMISVPGRDGDLFFDNGRFRNISVSYPAFISNRFQPRMDDFRAWLCSHVGYFRLEDTYHPDEFRRAMFKASLGVSTAPRNIAGRFTLSFDCKPQRWLKSGENGIEYSSSGKIYNPTEYGAKPLIRCIGTSGTVTINGTAVTVTGCTAYVDIDCEEMECFEGSTNRNGTTTLVNGAFPVLAPGENAVSFTGFTKVIVTPRWWRV